MKSKTNPEEQIAAILRNIEIIRSESKKKIFATNTTYLRSCITILSNLGVGTQEIEEKFTIYTNNRQNEYGAFTSRDEIRYVEGIIKMILEEVRILQEKIKFGRVA